MKLELKSSEDILRMAREEDKSLLEDLRILKLEERVSFSE